MDISKSKFIYYDSTEIKIENIIWGLLELGAEVERSPIVSQLDFIEEENVEKMVKEIADYDYVITQNFSVNVSEACHRLGKPYISWIYDSPQISLYTDYALYPENYVFAFDKKQVERLKLFGLKHIFYQPLVANMAFTSSINISDEDIKTYEADLSFIGQFYRVNYTNGLLDSLSEETFKKYISICNRLACRWDKTSTIYGTLDEDMINSLSEIVIDKDTDYFKMDRPFYQESLLFGPVLAQIERKAILSEAAKFCKTAIYTLDDDVEIIKKNVGGNVHPYVKGEIPYKIFFSSKLNLNLTLRRIETGIPQRVFDIMSVGGPVISNWQEEIEELFDPGKEIIVFHSTEEFKDKAKYYLSHDKDRQNIGLKGYQKVLNEYNYPKALTSMFSKL